MIHPRFRGPGATTDPPTAQRPGTLALLVDAHRARRQGPAAVTARQRPRLAAQVAYARARSPYYRQLYRGLPGRVEDPTLLPVTGKDELMARFDDWVGARPSVMTPAKLRVARQMLRVPPPHTDRMTYPLRDCCSREALTT
ncbi:hypothetical protein [Pseudonocardia sp. KRD291]|uniref:hypothetical protein n=1 Tax=Pseudonocardia sp. KRD291 TaxID=2792007 RepID=UPI001C4A666F|nr:hypothetical protein [Pseudonocardia sp. KRD291]MBW0105512.1 hypothetical protein [Pseudonocardia sp. KRD291]